MVTKEDIEGFLNRLSDGASHKELEPGLWVVKPGERSTSTSSSTTRRRS